MITTTRSRSQSGLWDPPSGSKKDALCTTNKSIRINPNYIMKYFTANHSNCRCQISRCLSVNTEANNVTAIVHEIMVVMWARQTGHPDARSAILAVHCFHGSARVQTAPKRILRVAPYTLHSSRRGLLHPPNVVCEQLSVNPEPDRNYTLLMQHFCYAVQTCWLLIRRMV